MERICRVLQGLKPALLMVLVQVAFAAVNVLYKLAANDGMNLKIIVAYRFIFATAFMVPLAFIVERKNRGKLTWTVIIQAFFCGLFGCSFAQNAYIESLALISATFACAMANLIPAVTFVLAFIFRMERMELASTKGKAKAIGTLMGIGGAMLLTFYKGVEISNGSAKVNLLHHRQYSHAHGHGRDLLGFFMALLNCLSYSLWLIVQAKMSARYRSHYSNSALVCAMGAIQATVFALCLERDWNQWKLGWNIRLLTAAFSGVVGSGLMGILISWCLAMRGPLFVAIFSPLMLVLVAIAGSLLLAEKLYLGSILGALLIICGLYFVLWGKSQEMKAKKQLAPSETETFQEDGIIVTSPTKDTCSDNSRVDIGSSKK
ncbi:WAT1-related protein At1g25270 [Populus alba]|uniref:WAT1-related protein n=2 Tax=Populus TaxID=3689 RepID=A0A4U5PM54_POPAL|nr:WAT1-related protein At1g25270-like [Populus alba]KAJ7010720.1 WAT1-related protein [Populus alba x Populus x berolinensis]TKR97456.1 WAT1-related protein [Populus alba]